LRISENIIFLGERVMTAIKERCSPHITFEAIKIVLAIHEFEQTSGTEVNSKFNINFDK
jgi:hypothetical protein